MSKVRLVNAIIAIKNAPFCMFNYKNIFLLVPFILTGCGVVAATDKTATNTEEATVNQHEVNEAIELTFVEHLEAGMTEQDVFIEQEEGSNDVYRVIPEEREKYSSNQLYASTVSLSHDVFEKKMLGPYLKGKSLNMTLENWLSAEGTAQIQCENGKGALTANFSNLVPNGIYTMWNVFLPRPLVGPLKMLDLPIGARDGSEAKFTADGEGSANYNVSDFEHCLQLSGDQLVSVLALTWQSDGVTHASTMGSLGETSHVQLFVALPNAE